jgi:RNA polymerase sigma-70 factor (ECF subfamily)
MYPAMVNHSEASEEHPVPTLEPQTDEQLMVAFSRGSADAFDTLFQRYRQPIFGFFHRRLTDGSHAEELTQETFLAILRAHDRYQAAALFRTWLYAIALRILQAHRRKAAFRAMFTSTPPPNFEPPGDSGTDAGFVLREAVAKLDPMDREIVFLREFEELSYTEIAELLRIPVNTVRSRLFRARTALRELLTAPATTPDSKNFTHAEEQA